MMAPQALRFVVAWWAILDHAIPALSQDDAGINLTASTNIGNGGDTTTKTEDHRPPSLLGDGGKLQLPVAQETFWDSFFLQLSAGDLPSAVEGYDALATARRGTPWKRGSATFAGNVETPGNGRRVGQMATGEVVGRAGGGGGGDDAGDGRSIGGSAVAPDLLEVFLGQYEGVVREFTSQAASGFAAATGEGFKVSSGWGADTFDPSVRGSRMITALHKLDHDREQLEYLLAKERLPQEFERLVKDYDAVRESIAANLAEAKKDSPKAPGRGFRSLNYFLGTSHFERLRGTYNSFIHVPEGPVEGGGGRGGGGAHSTTGTAPAGFFNGSSALNPKLDWEAIEEEYLSKEFPLVWFDGFLSPEALEGVLNFCLEATVFFDTKIGYVGAYMNDGLTSPWLVQIAHELQERLPRVLEGMTLTNLWAYKFDSDTSMDGISVHADSAAVNLNFWITPDEANLDPSSGGLVVYPKMPPQSASSSSSSSDVPQEDSPSGGNEAMMMKLWNNSSRESAIKAWLEDEGVVDLAVTVPYRQNRVVLFDSRLLHESDKFHFREGYENRRINLTFLFSPAGPPRE